MSTVYVKQGTLSFNGKTYIQGSVLPVEVLKELAATKELDKLVHNGVFGNVAEDAFKDAAPENNLVPPPLNGVVGAGAQGGGQVSAPNSKWSIDPATLTEKTLEQLNVMVRELDPGNEVELFETAEEARSFLSQDYIKPK